MDTKQVPDGTRISVALLIPQVIMANNADGVVGCVNFGLVRMTAKGTKRVQALGGAAFLTPEGHSYLVEQFGAHDFSRDDEQSPWDARFYVDDNRVDAALSVFDKLRPDIFDTGPLRDAGHELVEAGVLAEEELKKLYARHLGVYRQPTPLEGTGTSVRGSARRLFHLFQLTVDEVLYGKILKSDAIRKLVSAELATTDGGRKKGQTADGIEIADNLFDDGLLGQAG